MGQLPYISTSVQCQLKVENAGHLSSVVWKFSIKCVWSKSWVLGGGGKKWNGSRLIRLTRPLLSIKGGVSTASCPVPFHHCSSCSISQCWWAVFLTGCISHRLWRQEMEWIWAFSPLISIIISLPTWHYKFGGTGGCKFEYFCIFLIKFTFRLTLELSTYNLPIWPGGVNCLRHVCQVSIACRHH